MNRIIGKIILESTISNKSNLLISSGEGELLDFELLRQGGKVFIPSSSLSGVMRNYFKPERCIEESSNEELKQHIRYFWGTKGDDIDNAPSQSHFILDDLICTKLTEIAARDGVVINDSGTSDNYYNYELLEPDAEFKMRMEVNIRQNMKADYFLMFLKVLIDQGTQEGYDIGAFTSHDFGKIIFSNATTKLYYFDFVSVASKKAHIEAWWEYLSSGCKSIKIPSYNFNEINIVGFSPALKKYAHFEITLKLRNSMIIGSSNLDSFEKNIDKVHLKNSKNEPILSSKSMRGAIRSRAVRILNTLWGEENIQGKELIDAMFGYLHPSNEKNIEKKEVNAGKGRIVIKETNLKCKVEQEYIQSRIAIDRFSGGAMPGALFTAQPIWDNDNDFTIDIWLYQGIDEKEFSREIGLILLVLKDLMMGDLAIGGDKAIGKGTFIGTHLKAKIDNKDFKFSINKDFNLNEISVIEVEYLESFVKSLQNN